jgi:hypothetical protein
VEVRERLRKMLEEKPDVTASAAAPLVDEEPIKAEARYDGLWVLRSNSVYNAETVAHVYKALWTVEDIFRATNRFWKLGPSTTSVTRPFEVMCSAAFWHCYSKPSLVGCPRICGQV